MKYDVNIDLSYLCVLEIVSPQGSNFILTTYIPYCKADVFIFYSFHIKTCNKPNKINIVRALKYFLKVIEP